MNKQIKVGDFAEIKKAFSQEEVNSYNKICGDNNPIHYDYNYASKTFLKDQLCPGFWLLVYLVVCLGPKSQAKEPFSWSGSQIHKTNLYWRRSQC